MRANTAGSRLPQGVARAVILPEGVPDDWPHLFLPDAVKERLLNQAVFTLAHRRRLRTSRTGLHGLVLLAGPPGTGKTTTARAVAREAAQRLSDQGETLLVEIDPHALPSDLLGASQRNVAGLLEQALPDLAAGQRFTVVLVDEVETLATRRAAASFDTNPADLHRATDAALTGLDRLAAANLGVLVLATTNFLAAVDEALVSRADLVVGFDVPELSAVVAILRDTLLELARSWPSLEALAEDEAGLDELAKTCAGLDGRRLRKLVVAACTVRTDTALDPGRLTIDDLLTAAQQSQG